MNNPMNTLRAYSDNDRNQNTKIEGLKKEVSGIRAIKVQDEYFRFSSVMDEHNAEVAECQKLQAEEDDLIFSIRSLINGQL